MAEDSLRTVQANSGRAGSELGYLHWTPTVAGALIAAALSLVLLSFGASIGLAVASPSSSWRDTSAALALLGGLWLLLTSLASFGIGGYLAGRLRPPMGGATVDEVEFRDGSHGLVVWGLAVILSAFLALATTRSVAPRPDLSNPTASNAESLLALELDRLFRSDRPPAGPSGDAEIRSQAARILTTDLGRTGISMDDRAYLVHLVETRTGLMPREADGRVAQALSQAREAVARARHASVILAFMIGASLMIGAAAAWVATTLGGRHRDHSVAPSFWRRWEVDRMFLIR